MPLPKNAALRAWHAVHRHRRRSVHIRLARRGNRERAVGKLREEYRERPAIRLLRLLPDALMNAREILSRFMPIGRPINRGARAGIVDDVKYRIEKSERREFSGERGETRSHI